MNALFWSGKKVLLTGHTGFKGSWLGLWLHQMGAIVQGYSLAPPSEPSLFKEAKLETCFSSELGDVRDLDNLSKCVQRFKPDVVLHLAAQSLVHASYDDPFETYSTNVMGTLSLLEAVRKQGDVRVVVNVTSDKCYENKEWLWGYRENEAMGGFDPYSSSKGCSELLTASYRQSYFHPQRFAEHGCALASARAGNVIGGGDWAAFRLVPDVLSAFQRNQPVLIRNPNAVRPWQHVLEPLSGYLLLAETLYTHGANYAESWNFGPKEGNAQTVQHLVERLGHYWGSDATWTLDADKIAHEAHLLKLDCSKAKAELGWFPRWDLDETLQRTVAWHKAWLQGANMIEHTLQDINHYMNFKEVL